jgi:KDO2-lipid IV(A) lauroyltransferase
LWLLVQLPYPVIYRLGTALGRLAMRVMKSRARIARRNLELCFPEMSAADREALLVKNFESLGMGLMETGMAWFWPTHGWRAGPRPAALTRWWSFWNKSRASY